MEPPADVVAGGLDALESQVAIVDADGVIVYTNDAWDDFGRENGLEGSAVGPGDDYLAVSNVDIDDTNVTAQEGLAAVLAGDRHRFSLEYPCHSPSEKRWFMMRATPFTADGERFAIVMHVDITERKLAEIRAGERTEQLELVARVLSHDLRNPLNVAMGRLDTGDTGLVAAQLERMNSIIENALVLARGGEDLELSTVDLERMAREAWESVETSSAVLEIESTRELSADARILPHLFENLFRNSVEHAGDDVTVTVGTMEDGFYVEDDGPGLPERDVFEPGVSEGGTGLGLVIVQALADAHGWTIRTLSGGGARFAFIESGP